MSDHSLGMPKEELKQAHRERTWLVWEVWHDHDLVRVEKYQLEHGRVFVVLQNGDGYHVAPSNLRIATPNDMLKYGEG